MRYLLPVGSKTAVFEFEPFGQAAKEARCFLRDLFVRALGAEDVVIAEESAKNLKRWERAGSRDLVAVEVIEGELVNALGGGGKVGVYLKALEVANDKKWRIAEFFTIVVELVVGFFQALVLAFVLPSKVVAQPHVGEALSAMCLPDVFLKGVVFSGCIGSGGMLFTEHVAEVKKMGLRASVLGLREQLPTLYKLRDGERHE